MTDTDLARDLEALVLTVDGVEQVYSRTPALLAVVSSAVATVVGSAPPAPVALSQGPDGLVVEVSVAVSGSRPAAETGRAVFDALMAHLDALPGAPAVGRVAVEVSRVG